eukprot:gnl/TRDRNA2_/TRDRNA2_177603_c12_seq1.p1 gnl/TRDRNA2_/TRDRNA2_177603_c12~~gnl/TRDRNA2_/TRDRNA2_177603_c12_seq1.p1  ORF type:complete len:266 (+),score=52.89 gnl/TRDRNA2_/TRDRNA2_177603_c12_seq1:54-851(+)
MSENDMALLRITLLGLSNSGKTCLVNAFVNNIFIQQYTSTLDPTLYYTTVRFPADESEKFGFSALVEIEDCFPTDGCGGPDRDWPIKLMYDLYWPDLEKKKYEQAAEKDRMEGKKVIASLREPLSMYDAPVHGNFLPLSRNRMAFLICFDANAEPSYSEALKIEDELRQYFIKRQYTKKPLIYFVANKIDKDPSAEMFQTVVSSARLHTEFQGIPYFEVSSMQYKGVKKLFRHVVQAIRSNNELWQLSPPESHLEELAGKACSIQ